MKFRRKGPRRTSNKGAKDKNNRCPYLPSSMEKHPETSMNLHPGRATT
jgi:hypothetical protein